MSEKKNTGLGETSLLLRRTTPTEPTAAEAPTPENVPDVSDVLTSDRDRHDAPPARVRRSQRRAEPKPILDRCTIYLEPEINKRLSLAAAAADTKKKDRSSLVNAILRRHLPRYEVSTN